MLLKGNNMKSWEDYVGNYENLIHQWSEANEKKSKLEYGLGKIECNTIPESTNLYSK